jgi:CheY-like chemotaxis protein
MGGKIGVISEVGKGATIWFTARLPAATLSNRTPRNEQAPEIFSLNRGKILLVDDLQTNREIVGAYLEDGGYDVVPIGNGAEAISRLRKEKFELVLMDIQMPDMDGVTATRAIREMGSSVREIPILAMTGNVLPQQIQEFIKAGMNDHVGKPLERACLYSKLWRWLPRNSSGDSPVPPGSPHFNRNKLEDLIGHFGVAKVEHTLLMFEKELRRCFKSDLASSRREAHDLINSAGVLGFETLLERARALNDSSAGDDEAFRTLARCREARDAVLEVIGATILPQLIASARRRQDSVAVNRLLWTAAHVAYMVSRDRATNMFNQHVRLERVSALLLLRRGGKGSVGCSDHFPMLAKRRAPAPHSITYRFTLRPGFASHQVPSAVSQASPSSTRRMKQ